jgi:hypothetical protein
MPQIYDMGPPALLPLRRKACWEFFFSPWKIRRLRPSLNPRTWVLEASTHRLDHRSRYQVCVTVTEGLPFLFEYTRNPFQGKLHVNKGKCSYFPAKYKSVEIDSNLDEVDLLVSQQAVVSPLSSSFRTEDSRHKGKDMCWFLFAT